MKQTIMAISGLCMMAALCSQLLSTGRYMGVVRIVIGFEIVLLTLSALENITHALN